MNRLIVWCRTWYHLLTHARTTALILDDCLRAMGQMDHLPRKAAEYVSQQVMTMPISLRHQLITRGHWQALPSWKWRND